MTRNISSPLAARPTIYRGIEMRSRLEALWAAHYDREARDPTCDLRSWEYEPCCYASLDGQYLPDFRLDYGEYVEYVDVKGTLKAPRALMAKMEIILASEPLVMLQIAVGKPDEEHRSWGGSVLPQTPGWVGWFDHDRLCDPLVPLARLTTLDGELWRGPQVAFDPASGQLFQKRAGK